MLTRSLRLSILAVLASVGLFAYPSGSRIPTGNAGEPGTGTPCASCHSVTLNPSGGSVTLTTSGTTFTAGATQRWTVMVNDSNSSYHKGFQLTATAGMFTAVSNTTVASSTSGRQYVSHTTSATSYTFDWVAPSNTDSVTVYVAGAAATGTRSTNVYTSSVTLTKAASLPAISSVVNGASFVAGIAPGSWVTIFGSNLAPSGVARWWTGSEIVDGKLPTLLEGTQVKINGNYAAVAYVSPTQLNVQAPDDTARGSVAVEVITSSGTSSAGTATLQTAAPGLFRFSPDSSRYAAAVAADGAYIAPAGYFGSSVTSRAATPGEVVVLYGTGFGPTSPGVTAGISFAGAAPLSDGSGLAVTIGGMVADVKFAGLVTPGLYQFNVVVPALADGDQPVAVVAWGTNVSTVQYLPVKQ